MTGPRNAQRVLWLCGRSSVSPVRDALVSACKGDPLRLGGNGRLPAPPETERLRRASTPARQGAVGARVRSDRTPSPRDTTTRPPRRRPIGHPRPRAVTGALAMPIPEPLGNAATPGPPGVRGGGWAALGVPRRPSPPPEPRIPRRVGAPSVTVRNSAGARPATTRLARRWSWRRTCPWTTASRRRCSSGTPRARRTRYCSRGGGTGTRPRGASWRSSKTARGRRRRRRGGRRGSGRGASGLRPGRPGPAGQPTATRARMGTPPKRNRPR